MESPCSDGAVVTIAGLRSELNQWARETIFKEFSEVGVRIRRDCQEELSGLRRQIMEVVQSSVSTSSKNPLLLTPRQFSGEQRRFSKQFSGEPRFSISGSQWWSKQGNTLALPPTTNPLRRAATPEASSPATLQVQNGQEAPSSRNGILPSTVPTSCAETADSSLKPNKISQVVPIVDATDITTVLGLDSEDDVFVDNKEAPSPVVRWSMNYEEIVDDVCGPSLGLELLRNPKTEEMKKRLCEMSASEILASNKFDNLIGFLIMLNAVTIGVQTDYMARNVTDAVPDEFNYMERFFLVVFSSELFLRLYVHKLKFFYTGSVKWNWFDFFVVMSQLFEEIMLLVAFIAKSAASGDSDEEGGDSFGNMRIMRLLRVLRLMRVLRVMRVLRLISELRTIVSSIAGSLKSLLWTVVLLVLMMYMVGIYFTQSITQYLVDVQDVATPSVEETQWKAMLSYHFGSLFRSILSLYEAISGGVDWDSIANPMAKINPLMGVFFVMYVAFALLAMMNVVTGVFVQEALKSAKEEEDNFITEQIITLFRMGEHDQGGSLITVEDVVEAVAHSKDWKAINISPEEARYLFNLLDIHGSKKVKFEEFLSGCLRIHGGAKAIDVLTLMQEFRRFSATFKHVQAGLEECFDQIHFIHTKIGSNSEFLRRLADLFPHLSQVVVDNGVVLKQMDSRMQTLETSLGQVKELQRDADTHSMDVMLQELRFLYQRPSTPLVV